MTGGNGFDEIAWLRANSPAWRLLRAENAPLVLSFLHQVFVADTVRSIPAAELASRLDDELFALNERVPGSFPKQARAYLDKLESLQLPGFQKRFGEEGAADAFGALGGDNDRSAFFDDRQCPDQRHGQEG